MVRRIVAGTKDGEGAYLPPSPPVDKITDLSIDDLLLKGLTIIDRTMRVIQIDVSTGVPSREAIMNLKDCMAMLHELKKQEIDLLDSLTDEELESVARSK